MTDKSNRAKATEGLKAANYLDARIPPEAYVLTRAAIHALLDIADAIREHTARTTHPAGKDHS